MDSTILFGRNFEHAKLITEHIILREQELIKTIHICYQLDPSVVLDVVKTYAYITSTTRANVRFKVAPSLCDH